MAKEKTTVVDDRTVAEATWVLFESITGAIRIFALSVSRHGYSYVEAREVAFSMVNTVRKAFGYSKLVGFPGTPGRLGVQSSTELTEEEKNIVRFLASHSQLAGLVEEVRDKAQEYFPGSTLELHLDVHSKVEGWEELWANIVTDLPMDKALAQQRKLDEDWFLDQTDRAQDLFNIDIIVDRAEEEDG